MDKTKLKQYRALLKEQELNDKAIDRLNNRVEEVPVVLGKVVGSSRNFPFLKTRMTVQMDEPKESDEISKRLKIREVRQEQIRQAVMEIEEFISEISDSTDRQILELTFLEGKKQREVANIVGYSRGRISQIISKYIKD